jgi:hypothetical protein
VSLAFFVAHQTAGRTRLRVIEMPDDPALLVEASEHIAALQGVETAQPRLETGSVVIGHPYLASSALLQVLVAGGIQLQREPERIARPALAPFRERLDRADGLVREMSQGSADLHTLAFLGLGGLAVMQMLRGQTLTNASAFLWYAFQVANRSRDGR